MIRNHNGSTGRVSRAPGRVVPADFGLILMALIWGVNFPVIKSALSQIPPLAFNALRFPLAALTVLLILLSGGGISWPERTDVPRIIALGILGNIVYQSFFIFGLDGTLAGNASILLATIPIWTLILSILRRHEDPAPAVVGGILTTLLGMAMVVLGGELAVGVQGETLWGDILMVGAAMAWASYTVASRHLVWKYGATPVAAWTLWIGSAGLVVMGLPSLFRLPVREVTPGAWVGVAYAGILAIGLAYVLWNRGIGSIGSSRTAAYQNLTPVVALMVAFFWLGEVPGRLQMVGIGVVLVGITLARLGGRGREKARPLDDEGT